MIFTEIEGATLIRAAELLKVLGYPIRLQILLLLTQGEQLSVSALQSKLHMEQSAISQHLIKMKNKGILKVHRKGARAYYYVHDPSIVVLLTSLLTK